jgi:AcrR family transcriptional regulator
MKNHVDRRVLRTRQQCVAALVSLIQKKGFDALTVQDIIDEANIGRSTFYAHFEGKEDLLLKGLGEFRASLREAQKRALQAKGRPEDRAFVFSHEMFTHTFDHRFVYRAMSGKQGGALLQQFMQRMLVELVQEDVKAMGPKDPDAEMPQEAIVQFIAGGLWGMMAWWLGGKNKLSAEEVNALFRRLAVPLLSEAVSQGST